jgi:probable rRNA maturation factor
VRALATRLGEALKLESAKLSVLLTDDAGIRGYNERFRGKAEPTDVLSFPATAGMPGESGHYLGDLVVSVERAAAQAADYGHGLADEVEVLVLHGVLHLLGHDHETDAGEMRRLEQKLAREIFGSPRGLIARAEGDDGPGRA